MKRTRLLIVCGFCAIGVAAPASAGMISADPSAKGVQDSPLAGKNDRSKSPKVKTDRISSLVGTTMSVPTGHTTGFGSANSGGNSSKNKALSKASSNSKSASGKDKQRGQKPPVLPNDRFDSDWELPLIIADVIPPPSDILPNQPTQQQPPVSEEPDLGPVSEDPDLGVKARPNPEPSSLILIAIGAGLGAIRAVRRRRS